jgi:hypothetical protein
MMGENEEELEEIFFKKKPKNKYNTVSEFIKYQHVERYDKTDCIGLLEGVCYIFPKIDGTNASVWMDEPEQHGICEKSIVLGAGSRKRKLSEGSDNAGFHAWVTGSGRSSLGRLFSAFPGWRLYGEWLVPHTIKGYREDAWRKFYVFDVTDEDGKYIHYYVYKDVLEKYGLDYIPAMAVIKNPTPDGLVNLAKSNQYLMEDGQGSGEGIVIKNYDFVNRYGRVQWGKLVLNEFKDKHSSNGGPRKIQETKSAAENIAEKYVTKSMVDKELAKVKLTGENLEKKKLIHMLFNFVWDDLMGEMKNIAKEFKRPILDFKQLHYHMCNKIRETQPDIFS